MISKFAKKQAKFTANRIFTDRVNPTRVFTESMASLSSKPQEIIVYYGKGGIGKTRLLKQLCGVSETLGAQERDHTLHNVFLSFDAREITDEIGVMTSLRSKLHGDGGLFDYALICYWAKARFTVDEIRNKGVTLSAGVRRILDEVAGLGSGSITIPAFMVDEARRLIKDERIKTEYGEDVEELAQLNEAEIFERLPYYLGVCFSLAADKGHFHVFFFDSYEHIKSVSASRDWFMEFLASCETLRACIASRDKLKWGMENEEWDTVLNQHRLANLSDEDSRWFLEQVPIHDADVIDKIVLHSGGVPLFLDMSVDLYQEDMNNNREPDFSKIRHGEKLIDRYMNYLDDDSASAIKVLSVPDSFNTEFALGLLQRQGLHFNEEKLHTLFEKSIVLSVEAETDLWKIDESVRIHLRDQISPERIAHTLSDMLACVKEAGDGRAFPYFLSVLHTVKEDPKCLIGLNEAIVAQIDYYGNSGFWMELNTALEDCVDSEIPNLRAIAIMARIIYIRRTGNLRDEERFIDAHPLNEETLGCYYFMYCYFKIQCRHLQGRYDEAIESYRKLLEKMDLIRQIVPTHIYHTVSMKYADLLFLQGRFDESLTITEELLKSSSLELVDELELMRIKGHIFKFRERYGEARIIYLTALKIVREKKLDAYLGKLLTNMAEVSAFTDPAESVEWFEKARLVNEKSGNLIELGKAYAACSIAHASMAKQKADAGETEAVSRYVYDALALANQSISFAKQAGYRSGEAFALVGLALANKHGGHTEEYKAARERLETLLGELNVYRYLLALTD